MSFIYCPYDNSEVNEWECQSDCSDCKYCTEEEKTEDE